MARPAASPRLSVNKLCEYTEAGPTRQRQILRDQKFPSDFKGTFYREAADAIARCLASNMEDTDILVRAVESLEQMPAEKVGTARRINANIDAIDTFSVMLDDINFGDAVPSLGANSAPHLQVHNVQISVRPDIFLTEPGKKGRPLLGSVKLHFPRTFALTKETSGYASALLQEWHRTYQADAGLPHGPICYVIDVGAKQVWPGVKSTAARMKEISSHCQNIAALWPTITTSG